MGRAIAALLGLLLTVVGPQQDIGTVQVRVVRSDTGRPLTGVQVSLTRFVSNVGPGAGPPEPSRVATTDLGGLAVFSGLEEGRYTAFADPEGYFGVGERELSRGVSALRNIEPGQGPHEITLSLLPGASVQGRVLSSDGSPLPEVDVTPFRVIYPDGLPVLERLTVDTTVPLALQALQARLVRPQDVALDVGARTDESGRYELLDLPPGDYYIRADLSASESSVAARVDELADLSYYPGIVSASQARPLPIRPGDVLTGIDIVVGSSLERRISGTVRAAAPGILAPEGCIVYGYYLVPREAYLAQEEPARLHSAGPRSCELDEGVAFELPNVSPGRYDLYALVGDLETVRSTTGPTYYSGHVPVEVRDEDLSGVVVDIQKGATLNGQIVLQDDPGDTPPRFERIDLNLVPTRVLPEYAQPMRASGLQRRVDESGRFVVENVPQGEYRLVLEGGLPPGTYLADVRQGAASIYSSPTIWFDTADPTPIEIVLARGGGRIQGNVRFGTLPAGDGSVVLVPEPGHRENFSLYRVNGTSAGEFSFRDIAPGRYSVFAVESLPEGAEWNREFLARYEGRGLPVTIERDEIVVVELQRIPALP